MNSKTYVIGVGITKFDKPGTKEGDYPDWAKEAGEKALRDAGIPYDRIEQAYAGYVYGDSSYGQRAHIENEIAYSREIFRKHANWPDIDVTNRAIEETAADILRIYTERNPNVLV